ncbi:hypothetical protein EMCRGX_G004788 [Ephydatia muelleri]
MILTLSPPHWLDGWKEFPSWQNAKKNETLSDSTATFIKTAAPNKRLKDVFETIDKQTRYTRLRSKLHAVEKNLKDAIARQTLHQDGGGDYTEEFATYRIDTGVPGHDNQPVFLRKHLASLRVLAL